MMKRRDLFWILPTAVVALTAAACPRSSSAPAAPPAATDAQSGALAGAWIHREMPVRYLETMTLAVRGDRVTGTGTYMMEGGRTGNTTIAGTYRGGALTLDITRDTGSRERYTGRLEGGKLTGQLTIEGQPQPFTFERPPTQ